MTDKQRNICVTILSIVLVPVMIAYMYSGKSTKLLVDKDLMSMDKKLKVYFKHRVFSLIYHLLTNKYYRNIFYNRIGRLSIICSWFLPRAKDFFPCKNIGGGAYPAHPYATILNAKSIGDNCSFRQCTTLGNKRDGENDNCPILGDNVTIGANVCIIGNIKIGNNVIIGAGSVVVKDVPDNVIIAGNPARIIKKKEF